MLACLRMKLKCHEELSYQMSSLFQGALMELLPTEYAEYLHISKLHPYAQHLEVREGTWYWVVNCLEKEAYDVIILQTLMLRESVTIRKGNLTVILEEKFLEQQSHKKLAESFYEETSDRYIQLHFVTPTAFKSHGKYLFYPDIRCIYQSLMCKYDAVTKEESLIDEEALEELAGCAEIIRYDLKSVPFHLEGVKIPAFIGKITLKLGGTQTMVNFANMLFRFGEFSGVGIKTGMGMGTYKIIEKEKGKIRDGKSE